MLIIMCVLFFVMIKEDQVISNKCYSFNDFSFFYANVIELCVQLKFYDFKNDTLSIFTSYFTGPIGRFL